tara:strand:- start:244 stop:600 length:357 start_codon:yes stop_codon:yes gene_type:complete
MANNYQLKIAKIFCAPTLKDGDKVYNNLVTRVEYEWIGTSESGTKASIGYTKDLGLPGDDYVLFDKLEEGNIKNWVNDDELRNMAIKIIDEQIIIKEENKFQQTNFPWNVVSEPDKDI